MHQRRRQLPFNLATGEGVLYETWMDAFSMPGPPGSGAPGTMEPTTEKALDPASLLGSLHRQDHSLYTQPQKPSPQLPIFAQIEDLDVEQAQSTLEQAFLDSHALLSVPGQIQTSQKRSVTGDLTSEAMIDSLEQILGDIGDEGIEGLEVEETELRDWENTLDRMNNEREDASMELDRILANDVFSYVEEALRRETGGFVQGSHQTGNSSEPPMTDTASGFSEQTLSGDVLGDVGCSVGLKDASQVVSAHIQTPTQCRNTRQGHTPRLWPTSSSGHHRGNQRISTQSCHAVNSQPDVTQHTWFPSEQNATSIHSSRQFGLEVTDQSAQYTINQSSSQQTYVRPQLCSPSAWQQQQLQSFHHHTLTHSSHTPGSMNSTAQSFHPETQRLSGSCMYEKREVHITNAATVPAGQNGPLLGPPRSRGATHAGTTPNASFTLSYPAINQGTTQSSSTDVRNISLVPLNGDGTGLGTARSDYPPENGPLQSSFFCWNGHTQVNTSLPLDTNFKQFQGHLGRKMITTVSDFRITGLNTSQLFVQVVIVCLGEHVTCSWQFLLCFDEPLPVLSIH